MSLPSLQDDAGAVVAVEALGVLAGVMASSVGASVTSSPPYGGGGSASAPQPTVSYTQPYAQQSSYTLQSSYHHQQQQQPQQQLQVHHVVSDSHHFMEVSSSVGKDISGSGDGMVHSPTFDQAAAAAGDEHAILFLLGQ